MNRELRRILCIDDDPDILAIASLALESFGGFSLVTCVGGRAGIEKALEWQPDLILLDVMMPELDGPSVLKLLRESSATHGTPVIFMTARVEPTQVEEYRILGAADVITKPFDPVKLPAQVRAPWERLGEPLPIR